MKFNSLQDVYFEQLKDMYSAEKQLVEALPKMARAAQSTEVQQAFENHLAVTREHKAKVQAILDELDVNPGNKVCVAMEGLVKEAEAVIKKEGDATARDAALILAAQKAEHYEIATYGALRSYARTLGYDRHAATLSEILDQEYNADQKLDTIAEGGLLSTGLNVAAQA